MKDIYETLEHEKISLSSLRREHKKFLAGVFNRFEEGISFLSFKQAYFLPDSPLFTFAQEMGKAVEKTPLYKVCDDLAKRLGIKQHYLIKEEVVHYEAAQQPPYREFTTGEVAKLAGCTSQAVRKAIATWRLRARKVGRLALIAEADAVAFSQSIRHYGKKRRDSDSTYVKSRPS